MAASITNRLARGAKQAILAATRSVSDVVAPARCLGCGQSTGESSDWCSECIAELVVPDRYACKRCATPRPKSEVDSEDCPICRDERWGFDAAIALGVYRGVLRELLLEAKKPVGSAAASGIGRLLANELQNVDIEQAAMVVPMPMHWRRRLLRGVNSAERLADGLASRLRISVKQKLRRRRPTRPQTSVAPSSRPQNVRGAFAAVGRIAGGTVLLVDDVLTTGSSCSAAARELKRAGAERVVAVVAARRVAPT